MYRAYDVAGVRHDAPEPVPYLQVMTQVRDTGDTPGRRFANLIRQARLKKGWTQEELGEQSQVGRQTIIRYESGRAVNPDPEQVRAVCLALGVDPREAPIALGFFSRAEMGLPPRRTSEDKSIDEVIDILQNPEVPDAEKMAWIQYLRYLRDQHKGQQKTNRAV
jgi:transcriptional regulator with XRE-family HTH domain